ncbi:hypothetical protein, partial [Richelia intracellularis]|uniref:hypothetical protein n=1 Tax=Richelia intracellularis TaxID=1164990 RepID=UPI001E4926A1
MSISSYSYLLYILFIACFCFLIDAPPYTHGFLEGQTMSKSPLFSGWFRVQSLFDYSVDYAT